MAEYRPVAATDPARLLRECRLIPGRRSGPGGQHRNKVQTAVSLCHLPTQIDAQASERRSQQENLRMALFRLRLKLAVYVRAAVSGDHEPSQLWRSRCRRGQIAINPRHGDFPAVLAEALDVLAAHAWDPHRAAAVLGCTFSQLVKLLKVYPPAMQWANARRRELGGLRPLR